MSGEVVRLPAQRHDAAVEEAIRRAEAAAYSRGYDDGANRSSTLIAQARREAAAEAGDRVARAVAEAVRALRAEIV